VTVTSAAEGRAARVGILGGTFNPPHRGHVTLARHALEELGLDRVLLMPTGSPLHKPAAADPGAEHRLNMCRLAVEAEPRVCACALEIERGGPSYTVDTLTSIDASHPETRLTLIVGADTAMTLPAWRSPARLLELADLAVATRRGSVDGEIRDTVDVLAGEDGLRERDLRFLSMAPIEVSSSEVRRRVAAGNPVEELVGAGVAGYIAEHDLYTVPEEES
jgi:nicotinate-nucleotide adenylyltransferase